jgi:hypothetical protein
VLGQRWIAARDQPLVWIVRVREGDQVALVEQVELQLPALGELGDGAALQRRDPVDALKPETQASCQRLALVALATGLLFATGFFGVDFLAIS